VRKKKPVTSKAEVIPDAGHELILARVCGIDVAKASASVCVRVPPANGERRASQVREVPATMNTVVELAEELAAKGIEKVTVESTGDYWRIWFYLLEAAGLSVQLVNARDVKNVPGRGEDRQARFGVVGQTHRTGHAATEFRAAGPDPRAS
jgi:transposase